MATGLADTAEAPTVSSTEVRSSGDSRASVLEIKGGMYAFMALRLYGSDLEAIDKALADKVLQAPGFFRNTPVVLDLIDLEQREGGLADLDLGKLLACIRGHELKPVVASVLDRQADALRGFELPLIEGTARRTHRKGRKRAAPDADGDSRPSLLHGGGQRPLDAAEKAIKAAGEELKADSTADTTLELDDSMALREASEVHYVVKSPMLLTRPVRSGQQVYARETDLIVMGQVGPGAEIVADNNIHVYGPLRGRALCGVSGNRSSRIFCQSLEAELVSVAGVYRLLENIPDELRGKPAQIWLEDERLNIESL